MVSKVRSMGMEVCTTLGMLTPEQAAQLKVAGLSCYNHNLDTSPEFYPKITSSRNYDDRLGTLKSVRHSLQIHMQPPPCLKLACPFQVREAGLGVCSGGIIGMGEEESDRVGLIHTLATLPAHPESVPINALVPVEGTPLAETIKAPPTALELVRCVAVARIVMPESMVRLSAGRNNLSMAEQVLTHPLLPLRSHVGLLAVYQRVRSRGGSVDSLQSLACFSPRPGSACASLLGRTASSQGTSS